MLARLAPSRTIPARKPPTAVTVRTPIARLHAHAPTGMASVTVPRAPPTAQTAIAVPVQMSALSMNAGIRSPSGALAST